MQDKEIIKARSEDLSNEERVKMVMNNLNDALPVRVISILTDLDRRKIYKELKRMEKYREARKVAKRKVEYWKFKGESK